MSTRRLVVPLALIFLLPIPARANPGTGTVEGRVLIGPTGSPAGYANVIVFGTRLGAQADEGGHFRITNVPTGSQVLRALLVGYTVLTVPVEVAAGDTTKDIELVFPPRAVPKPADIGARSMVRAEDLVATIRPAVNRFHVGDKPVFEIRIKNDGTSPALLVTSVDASDAWASPSVKIQITGPEGGFAVRPTARCGNTNGVSLEDFIEVQPGDSFDPYAHGWIGSNLQLGTFQKPGRYEATFHYNTTERDPRRWISGPCIDCRVPESFYELLERVAAVDLVTRVEFNVAP